MTQTGWMYLGILLLMFACVVAFILRRMVSPAARVGAHSESIGPSGGHGDHSHDSGGGDGGSGD
ncbi:hypothetical protein NKH73_20730 [Mesorhizobium sp. M0938]|uniref:hypothetical protein n=1 Tax=unclassified Mesorhizobium TaxID=325217 RepID=UPI00333BADD3